MPIGLTREKFHNIISECSEKLHMTRDDDMFAFYLGMVYLKKAINQADASIQMEFTEEETKNKVYRENVDNNLCQLESMFKDYVCDVKGFVNESYYHRWLHEMNHVAEARADWNERAKGYGRKLHSFVFAQ